MAASKRSPGMVCSPASNVYVVKGKDTNTATPIIHAIALSGRPSQEDSFELNWPRTPSWCRKNINSAVVWLHHPAEYQGSHHHGGRPRRDERPPHNPPARETLIKKLSQAERYQHGDADHGD